MKPVLQQINLLHSNCFRCQDTECMECMDDLKVVLSRVWTVSLPSLGRGNSLCMCVTRPSSADGVEVTKAKAFFLTYLILLLKIDHLPPPWPLSSPPFCHTHFHPYPARPILPYNRGQLAPVQSVSLLRRLVPDSLPILVKPGSRIVKGREKGQKEREREKMDFWKQISREAWKSSLHHQFWHPGIVHLPCLCPRGQQDLDFECLGEKYKTGVELKGKKN